MQKLRYVERVARARRGRSNRSSTPAKWTSRRKTSACRWSSSIGRRQERQARIDIALDAHLRQIFLTRKRKESKPAADIVSKYARN